MLPGWTCTWNLRPKCMDGVRPSNRTPVPVRRPPLAPAGELLAAGVPVEAGGGLEAADGLQRLLRDVHTAVWLPAETPRMPADAERIALCAQPNGRPTVQGDPPPPPRQPRDGGWRAAGAPLYRFRQVCIHLEAKARFVGCEPSKGVPNQGVYTHSGYTPFPPSALYLFPVKEFHSQTARKHKIQRKSTENGGVQNDRPQRPGAVGCGFHRVIWSILMRLPF